MGVDYEVCTNCEDTFPDCGYFVRCDCGKQWCDDDCAATDGYTYECDEEENHESSSCDYCRGEQVEDYLLLEAAMKHLGIDRKQLIEIYKKINKG